MTLDEARATIAALQATIAEQATVIEDQDKLLYAAADALDKQRRQMTSTLPELEKALANVAQLVARQDEALAKAMSTITHQTKQLDDINSAVGVGQAELASRLSQLGRAVGEIETNMN